MSEEADQIMTDTFGRIFLLSRRFEYVTDHVLRKDNLTTKQLLANIAVTVAFDHPPTLGEVAEVLGTSHQNAKQLVRQLEKKGFVVIERDSEDKRRLRLRGTKVAEEYWKSRSAEHLNTIRSLFSSLTNQELRAFNRTVRKLLEKTEEVYRSARTSDYDISASAE
ncbi:MAG: MarR family winged helix-turn-helix transcriptional regulator [Candidatus Thorarchaeota archaeon]|nr:MAG: MarR family transcriptional regulator [Candidatus Thorarchaeota archaeon]RLI58845.1 MAG: MarR family transcriptional regulator [Candidatus Thorarchaeota archaeon]